MGMLQGAGLALLTGLAFSSSSFAITHYVNVSNATPVAPYTNWAKASTNIQMAIVWSDNGDEIQVAPGVYRLYGAALALPAAKTLTLRSTLSRAAVIDAQGLSEGILVFGTNCLIEGFTICNGLKTESGYGGGVELIQSGTLRDCLVVSNQANAAGGIMVGSVATNSLIEDCTIASNRALTGSGGGVVLYSSSGGRLNRCQVHDNQAATYAGGIWLDKAGSVSNCWIWNNQAIAEDGGGVYMACEGTTNQGRLVNSVITGNSALRWGGGLYASGPAGTLAPIINCTIVSNTAGTSGGGVFAWTTRLLNDIIYFNTAPDSPNLEAHDSSHSCIISNSCTTSNYFWPNITNAPAFVNAGAGDFRLATASFCIDTGTTNGAPATDIVGNPRPRRGMPGSGSTNCDMGAYEYGFHFNAIQSVSSNAMQFKWDIQDVGRYRLDIATNAAADPAGPAWNTVYVYTNATIIGAGQFLEYTLTVTNPVPPIPSNGRFRLRVDRSTPAR